MVGSITEIKTDFGRNLGKKKIRGGKNTNDNYVFENY